MRYSRRIPLVAAALAVTAWGFPTPANAATRHTFVVHPGESIQRAVDMAVGGDTVVVTAGSYAQDVTVQKDRLTLRADGDVVISPPARPGLCSQASGEANGICVIPADIDPATGQYKTRVKDVTVSGFHVKDFQNGVFGYGTDHLRVSHVRAENNAVYGIVNFDGRFTTISDNAASGSDEAGLYVGDAPDAHSVVKDNRSWNNALGILVRHTHRVTLVDNKISANCTGVYLLDDTQPEGSGDNVLRDNKVNANNKRCAGFPDEGVPPFSGAGIVLEGSQHNLIVDNEVKSNSGTTALSGGIVLRTAANGKGASFNTVRDNELRGNRPADIVRDATSVGNRFLDNECRTSIPKGVCQR
ncbi:MAG: NosD domain-containing protein [Terracoccus sp.]